MNNFNRVMTTDCPATFKIVVVEFCLQFHLHTIFCLQLKISIQDSSPVECDTGK